MTLYIIWLENGKIFKLQGRGLDAVTTNDY